MPLTKRATVVALLLGLTALRGASAEGLCTPSPQATDIADRATCPYKMSVDVDLSRIPPELPVTKCNCPGSLCSDKGDYRCQEVKSAFRVAYRDASSKLTNKTFELTTACVCVVSRSAGAVTGGQRTTGGDPHKLVKF
ncbi:hypothetical protein MTO96_034927 [Rhipicephalus appendiculatus]